MRIKEDLIQTAKDLKINASQAAELGLRDAVREKQAAYWLSENSRALDVHNARIKKSGPLLTPDWVQPNRDREPNLT